MSWLWNAARLLKSGKTVADIKDEEDDELSEEEAELAQFAQYADDGDEGEEGDESGTGEDMTDNEFFDAERDEDMFSQDEEVQEACVICGKRKGLVTRLSCARSGCPSTCHSVCAAEKDQSSTSPWFCQLACAIRARKKTSPPKTPKQMSSEKKLGSTKTNGIKPKSCKHKKASKCVECNTPLPSSDLVACARTGCSSQCHAGCAGENKLSWFCQPSCALREKKTWDKPTRTAKGKKSSVGARSNTESEDISSASLSLFSSSLWQESSSDSDGYLETDSRSTCRIYVLKPHSKQQCSFSSSSHLDPTSALSPCVHYFHNFTLRKKFRKQQEQFIHALCTSPASLLSEATKAVLLQRLNSKIRNRAMATGHVHNTPSKSKRMNNGKTLKWKYLISPPLWSSLPNPLSPPQIEIVNSMLHHFDHGIGCWLNENDNANKSVVTTFLAYLEHERNLHGPNLLISDAYSSLLSSSSSSWGINAHTLTQETIDEMIMKEAPCAALFSEEKSQKKLIIISVDIFMQFHTFFTPINWLTVCYSLPSTLSSINTSLFSPSSSSPSPAKISPFCNYICSLSRLFTFALLPVIINREKDQNSILRTFVPHDFLGEPGTSALHEAAELLECLHVQSASGAVIESNLVIPLTSDQLSLLRLIIPENLALMGREGRVIPPPRPRQLKQCLTDVHHLSCHPAVWGVKLFSKFSLASNLGAARRFPLHSLPPAPIDTRKVDSARVSVSKSTTTTPTATTTPPHETPPTAHGLPRRRPINAQYKRANTSSPPSTPATALVPTTPKTPPPPSTPRRRASSRTPRTPTSFKPVDFRKTQEQQKLEYALQASIISSPFPSSPRPAAASPCADTVAPTPKKIRKETQSQPSPSPFLPSELKSSSTNTISPSHPSSIVEPLTIPQKKRKRRCVGRSGSVEESAALVSANGWSAVPGKNKRSIHIIHPDGSRFYSSKSAIAYGEQTKVPFIISSKTASSRRFLLPLPVPSSSAPPPSNNSSIVPTAISSCSATESKRSWAKELWQNPASLLHAGGKLWVLADLVLRQDKGTVIGVFSRSKGMLRAVEVIATAFGWSYSRPDRHGATNANATATCPVHLILCLRDTSPPPARLFIILDHDPVRPWDLPSLRACKPEFLFQLFSPLEQLALTVPSISTLSSISPQTNTSFPLNTSTTSTATTEASSFSSIQMSLDFVHTFSGRNADQDITRTDLLSYLLRLRSLSNTLTGVSCTSYSLSSDFLTLASSPPSSACSFLSLSTSHAPSRSPSRFITPRKQCDKDDSNNNDTSQKKRRKINLRLHSHSSPAAPGVTITPPTDDTTTLATTASSTTSTSTSITTSTSTSTTSITTTTTNKKHPILFWRPLPQSTSKLTDDEYIKRIDEADAETVRMRDVNRANVLSGPRKRRTVRAFEIPPKEFRKKKVVDPRLSDNECFICKDGGILVLCDRCPRAYHEGCVDGVAHPPRRLTLWVCPWCRCGVCSIQTTELWSCTRCPDSYCRSHLPQEAELCTASAEFLLPLLPFEAEMANRKWLACSRLSPRTKATSSSLSSSITSLKSSSSLPCPSPTHLPSQGGPTTNFCSTSDPAHLPPPAPNSAYSSFNSTSCPSLIPNSYPTSPYPNSMPQAHWMW